jgi:hypothetical protein
LSIGVALPTSKAVQKALEPSIGRLGAVLVSIVAAGAVAGLVAMVVILVLKLNRSQHQVPVFLPDGVLYMSR